MAMQNNPIELHTQHSVNLTMAASDAPPGNKPAGDKAHVFYMYAALLDARGLPTELAEYIALLALSRGDCPGPQTHDEVRSIMNTHDTGLVMLALQYLNAATHPAFTPRKLLVMACAQGCVRLLNYLHSHLHVNVFMTRSGLGFPDENQYDMLSADCRAYVAKLRNKDNTNNDDEEDLFEAEEFDSTENEGTEDEAEAAGEAEGEAAGEAEWEAAGEAVGEAAGEAEAENGAESGAKTENEAENEVEDEAEDEAQADPGAQAEDGARADDGVQAEDGDGEETEEDENEYAEDEYAEDEYAEDEYAEDEYAEDEYAEDRYAASENVNVALYQAVVHNHAHMVPALKNIGLETRHVLSGDGALLAFAAERGHVEVAEALMCEFSLDEDNLRARNNLPFRMACIEGQMRFIRFLDQRCDLTAHDIRSFQNCGLRWAIQFGHLDIVKLLHQWGLTRDDALARFGGALEAACENNNVSVVQYMFDSMHVTMNDVRTRHNACLYRICKEGCTELLRFLHARGLTALDIRSSCRRYDDEECYPVAVAAAYGRDETLRALFDLFDLNVQDARVHNNLPMRAACVCNYPLVQQELVRRGVSLEERRVNSVADKKFLFKARMHKEDEEKDNEDDTSVSDSDSSDDLTFFAYPIKK
jgi:hypothetical protein